MPAPTRTLVQKLAAEVQGGTLDVEAEVERAWSADDAESVTTYALAAAVAGKPLAASRVLDAVVLLDDLLIGALLTAHVTGNRVKALLDAVERDGTTDERDALALYLAARLHSSGPAPARLLALVRTHARRGASTACGELLVAASALLGDADVRAVVSASFPDVTLKIAQDAVAGLIAAMEGSILEALPDYAPPSLAAPIPLRHAGDRPGRNDPCPCGSGKKYKKCHQDGDAAAASADPQTAWRQQLEIAAQTMTPQQVVDLRLADLAALPYDKLLPDACLAAYRELIRHRRWDAAERALEAMSSLDEKAAERRIEFVAEAFRSRALEVAHRHAALLKEAGVVDTLVEALQTVATPDRSSLSRLEAIAEQGLRDAPVVLLDVADALLEYYPALGVVAARGALATAQPDDARLFLDLVEEARDRLGLPPGDPAADVHDALERFDRDVDAEASARKTAEELTVEVRALRSAALDATARIQELEGRLRDRPRDAGAPISPPPAAWEAERNELRDRIAELKAKVAEGNSERAQLRRKLVEVSDQAPPPPEERPAGSTPSPEAEPSAEHAPAEAPRVRGVMVPRFERAAEASLRDLPARVVRDSLRVIADLCSGEGNVWREIKQLERISPAMYSARIGIHYRVLFRMEPGALEIAEIVAREGLIAAVRRFWR